MTSQQLTAVVSSVNSNPLLSSLTSDRLFLNALAKQGISEHELGEAYETESSFYWCPTRDLVLTQYDHTGRFALIRRK